MEAEGSEADAFALERLDRKELHLENNEPTEVVVTRREDPYP
jgi:hypothetical protein